MAQPFLGQITMFAGNFAPKGYALCNGQTLPITQNAALFALLGTTYGGNGVSTFNLPNLQSQLPIHFGQGSGLSNYVIGQNDGVASVTLSQTTTPQHNHTFNASTSNATGPGIAGGVPATPTVAGGLFYANNSAAAPLGFVQMAAGALALVGGNQAHTNLMPSLCITFIIALQGVFPSRN